MAEERLEALGVLRGEAHAAARRAADDEGDSRRPAHHEAELRRLVRELVHGDGHEVGELQLDHGPHPGQRRSDAGADEAALGDGRVAHPVRAEALVHALRRPEDSADLADVLAHDEDGVVGLHLLPDGLAHRLGERERSLSGRRRDRVVGHVRGVDGGLHVGGVCGVVRERAGDRRLDLGLDLAVEGRDPVGVELAQLGQQGLEAGQRVAGLPRAHELLVADVRQIGTHRVGHAAERLRLDQRRAVAPAGGFDVPCGRLLHREEVVAVHDLAGHPVAGRAHRDVLDGAAVTPADGERELVVLADEDDRQLPGCGEVHRLVRGALVRAPVAEEDDGDLVRSAQLRRESGSDADRKRRAHDPVATEDVEREVGDVHRAAEAAAVAGSPAEQLRHHRVQVAALGDHVAVASVMADDVVVRPQHRADAHRHRLLADAAVRGARRSRPPGRARLRAPRNAGCAASAGAARRGTPGRAVARPRAVSPKESPPDEGTVRRKLLATVAAQRR